MTVFSTLLGKELREFTRTWRLWVLGGALLFAALTGPFLARYLTELLASLAGEQAAALTATLPDPDHFTAHTQWVSDLGQLGVLALALVAGSVIAAELSDDSALFILTRPVGRTTYLLAKLAALVVVLAGLLAAATLVNAAVTFALFGEVGLGGLLTASAAWFVAALLIIGVAAVVGALTASPLGAAAGAIGTVLVLGIAASWGPAVRWTPAGVNEMAGLLAGGQQPESAWPLVTAVAAAVLLSALAVLALRRREL